MKNKLLKSFINKKDTILNQEFHTNYKKYRNLPSTLIKKNKQAYYGKYFERNWNNIMNTRKGIKSLISLKTVTSNVPTVLSFDNGKTITNPCDITNTFNNYFASIAETTNIYIYIYIYIHINIFQTIFPMKVLVHYLCNLLIENN